MEEANTKFKDEVANLQKRCAQRCHYECTIFSAFLDQVSLSALGSRLGTRSCRRKRMPLWLPSR